MWPRGPCRSDTIRLMQGRSAGHDHDTGVPDRTPTLVPRPRRGGEVLQQALGGLRLDGAIFLRAEYREPWAYESLTGPVTAAFLRPGSERVILFHLVAAGRCWVSVAD